MFDTDSDCDSEGKAMRLRRTLVFPEVFPKIRNSKFEIRNFEGGLV